MSNMNNGNNLLKPGDYKLEKFTLTSMVNGSNVDLSNLYKKIEVYEDIFSPYITAKLYIEDSFNFPERIPIVGQEKIELSFRSDMDNMPVVELILRVYKLDTHKISDTGKTQQYVLHLMSEGGYFNHSEYCGYAVSGSVSDMVRSVFTKHFPESVWKERLDVEDTADNYSFVLSGAYSPFKAINWLCSKAFSTSGKEYSPYLFYETLDGHKFKSISKIIEDGSATDLSYIYSSGNMRALPGQREYTDKKSIGDSMMPVRYHKIQELEELSRFDVPSNIMNGVVSSRMIVHDLVRKQHRHVDFFESDVFDQIKKLGELPHFRNSDPEASRFMSKGAAYFYMPTTPYTVYSKGNQLIDNFNVESLYQTRKYHMNCFLTQKLAGTIFGDSRRRVGDILEINVPKMQSDSTFQSDNDKPLSGKYMITGIRHTLTDTYRCKVELSRNCMGV